MLDLPSFPDFTYEKQEQQYHSLFHTLSYRLPNTEMDFTLLVVVVIIAIALLWLAKVDARRGTE